MAIVTSVSISVEYETHEEFIHNITYVHHSIELGCCNLPPLARFNRDFKTKLIAWEMLQNLAKETLQRLA